MFVSGDASLFFSLWNLFFFPSCRGCWRSNTYVPWGVIRGYLATVPSWHKMGFSAPVCARVYLCFRFSLGNIAAITLAVCFSRRGVPLITTWHYYYCHVQLSKQIVSSTGQMKAPKIIMLRQVRNREIWARVTEYIVFDQSQHISPEYERITNKHQRNMQLNG